MNIITDINQLLNRAQEIDINEDRKLIREISDNLKATVKENNLTTLAAPQIGYPYRIFCIKFNTKSTKPDIRVYINPVVSASKGFTLHRESCSSLPGREFIYPRNTEVNLMYQTLEGGSFGSNFIGQTAFAIQQMVDLLDGVVLETMGLEIDELFDHASEQEKDQLLDAYMEALSDYKSMLDTEIKNDPELNKLKDAVTFMASVSAGETKMGAEITVQRPEETE